MNKYTTLSIRIPLNTQCDFLPFINLTPIVIAEYIKSDILEVTLGDFFVFLFFHEVLNY